MSTRINVIKGLFLLMTGFLILFSCSKKQEDKKLDATYATSTDSCNCQAPWFPHANTPPPAEDNGSPFDTTSTTNCIFHQWSVQKFLWLTRPMSNGHVFFQDSLTQVDAQLLPVSPDKKYPSIRLVLDDSLQAGSGGTLHSNPGFSDEHKSRLVHYSIFVSDSLLKSSVSFKKLLSKDTNSLNNSFTFPVGAFELKISWVDISSIPVAQQQGYYTTEAVIKSASGSRQAKVALLGIHVVGRVINHPEFIWATFEHRLMSPYYNWQASSSTQDSPITSGNEQLLYKKGTTTTLAGITWNKTSKQPDSLYRVYALYKYGVPRVALDSFMVGTSQTEPLNYSNVDNLNSCLASGLGTSDVWGNYFYNGSIWVNTDGLSPQQQAQLIIDQGYSLGNGQTGAIARGSLNVSNLTMETYVQTFVPPNTPIHSITVSNLANCLSCHSGETLVKLNGKSYFNKKSPLYISHIFTNYLGSTSKTTVKDAKLRGVLDFMERQKVVNKK